MRNYFMVYGVRNFTTKFFVENNEYHEVIEVDNEDNIIATALPFELVTQLNDLLEVKCSHLTRDVLLNKRKKNLQFQAITRNGEAIYHHFSPVRTGLYQSAIESENVKEIIQQHIVGYEEEINWLHNAWDNDFSVICLY